MKRSLIARTVGPCLGIFMLWTVVGGFGGSWNPMQWLVGTPRAQSPGQNPSNPNNPCNPCSPGAAKASNPCNPCAAKPTNPCNPCAPRAGNPCNPCSPGGAAALKAGNPCNPCAAKAANPCNPCAPRAANPCNPCAAKAANPCNPCAAKPTNPCNPCAASAANPCNPRAGAANPCSPGAARQVGMGTAGGKIGWAQDFKSWDAVTGYVISNSHGNRLVQTYIYPSEAARVYKHNAELSRLRKQEGFLPYPANTRIVQESWLRNNVGGPGRAGPVFFMRKEPPGYDSNGGDWHYGFTRSDLTLIGEGHTGKMEFCKECHAGAQGRDFIFATDR